MKPKNQIGASDPELTRKSRQLEELKTHNAYNPEQGDVIPGTGGVRKIRWGTHGKGKSGGARVIYYFSNDAPVMRDTRAPVATSRY